MMLSRWVQFVMLASLTGCTSLVASYRPDWGDDGGGDVGIDVTDIGADMGMDAGMDAGVDAGPDAGADAAADGGVDGAGDAIEEDQADVPADAVPFRCATSGDCADAAGGAVCDVATGRCVECVATADTCPAGRYCVAETQRCAAGCRDDEGCLAASTDGGIAVAGWCDVATHACVRCLTDSHCTPGNLCMGNMCVTGCSATQACPGGQTCCGGGCVDTSSNVANCGGCGTACSAPNGTATCVGATCRVGGCTAPFADCDGTAANGCEVDTRASIDNCGGCGASCPTAGSNSVATCLGGACRSACTAGWVDLDQSSGNGCEYLCVVRPGVDLPDPGFLDSNCDGIDGDISRGVFASPVGSDAAQGTLSSPVRSIARAVELAVLQSKPHVYIDAGDYPGSVVVRGNVSLYGGFDRRTTLPGGPTGYWGRRVDAAPVIAGGSVAVTVADSSGVLTLDSLQIRASDGAAGRDGQPSIGVYVARVANVLIRNCVVTAGAGGDGQAGADGTAGGEGLGGMRGFTSGPCGFGYSLGGTGGASSCGRSGGGGGNGVHVSPVDYAPGLTAQNGQSGSDGAAGGAGASSTSGMCPSTRTDGFSGGIGADGLTGGVGGRGAAGQLNGTVTGATWTSGRGADGNSGEDGGGGGGGGGGGMGFICSPSTCMGGGAGGGGGGGGCHGTGGSGGGGGGAAFGILSYQSNVQVSDCVITAGVGGRGGAGGGGGRGGQGGLAGLGVTRAEIVGSGPPFPGAGGNGGSGGSGGNGGPGGGGSGGPSASIAYTLTSTLDVRTSSL